jgi:hypothetical protein
MVLGIFHSTLAWFFVVAGASLAVNLPMEIDTPGGEGGAATPEIRAQKEPAIPAPYAGGFVLRLGEMVAPHRVTSVLVMPGESVDIEAAMGLPGSSYSASADEGTLRPIASSRWAWTAPARPGQHSIVVNETGSGQTVTLTAFVMVPFRHTETSLNGYTIGRYPLRPFKNNPIYLPPPGFVEVTEANLDSYVSPHFRLSQFVCKQDSAFPKYLILNPRLLMKLELIVEELNRRGYGVDTLHVMSGYRTPLYNAAIKNVRYSLHQWGYAADVFVDRDGDGMMDDLNQDGRIDHLDAAVISEIVEELDQDERFRPLAGGLGQYEKTHYHGPFVHVDVRGWDARWSVGIGVRKATPGPPGQKGKQRL